MQPNLLEDSVWDLVTTAFKDHLLIPPSGSDALSALRKEYKHMEPIRGFGVKGLSEFLFAVNNHEKLATLRAKMKGKKDE